LRLPCLRSALPQLASRRKKRKRSWSSCWFFCVEFCTYLLVLLWLQTFLAASSVDCFFIYGHWPLSYFSYYRLFREQESMQHPYSASFYSLFWLKYENVPKSWRLYVPHIFGIIASILSKLNLEFYCDLYFWVIGTDKVGLPVLMWL
jgi:hypothetical protein